MRKVLVVTSGLLLAAVILQFYFAAYGAFTIPLPVTTEEHHEAFSLHSGNTNVILVLSLLTTGAAWLAKAGLRTAILALAPFVLVILQIVIFIVAGAAGADIDATPPVANTPAHLIVALHAINGLAILGTALGAFVRSLKHAQAGSTVAAVTP
jgi:uncharacterized protein DUF6220